MEHDKIKAILKWPQPNSLKSLRGFLGLTGYYRKFIWHYGSIAEPLTALFMKDSYSWTSAAMQAFKALKKALIAEPVLALPDFNQTFQIECDASNKWLGAVLMQNGLPIALFSKAIHEKNLLLSTYEKELMTLVPSVQQ